MHFAFPSVTMGTSVGGTQWVANTRSMEDGERSSGGARVPII